MLLRAVSSVSELGVKTVTILELVSGSGPHGSNSDKQQDWLAVIASLTTTVVAACLSLVGAGSALSGAKVVATRMSNAIRVTASKSGSHA